MDPQMPYLAAMAGAFKGQLSLHSIVQAVLVALSTAILTSYVTVRVVEVQLADVVRRVNILEERFLIQGDRLSRLEGENRALNSRRIP